jgi:hypothetical protein
MRLQGILRIIAPFPSRLQRKSTLKRCRVQTASERFGGNVVEGRLAMVKGTSVSA